MVDFLSPRNVAYDLIQFRRTVHSQFGEDGILEQIFREIGEGQRWCLEVGAWDGLYRSNVASLLEQDWHGVLIEADRAKFAKMRRIWGHRDDVITLERRVDAGDSSLDHIIAETPAPLDLDLVSIDIDGDDYHVWSAMSRYRPKVVVIESNFSFPFNVEFVQRPGSRTRLGSSALSLFLLGKAKEYELVCYNVINCFFVRADLAVRIPLRDTSFATLFHLGLQHHLSVATSQEGTLFVFGDAVYGRRRSPLAQLRNWRIRRERELLRHASRFRIVRGEEYEHLLRRPSATAV